MLSSLLLLLLPFTLLHNHHRVDLIHTKSHIKMHFSSTIVAFFAVSVSAHGVVTEIKGANGVTMPGLTVADGTPRDCSSNRCGSQADTAIIRNRDIASGKATPLGLTQGNGPVNAADMIGNFMGNGGNPGTNAGAASSVGQEDNIQQRRQLFGGRLGGGRGRAGAAGAGAGAGAGGLAGLLGGGGGAAGGAGVKSSLPDEARVASTRGAGASGGLPTASDSGVVTMTLRQVRLFQLFSTRLLLICSRSTKMVLVHSLLMLTVHLVVLTSRPCNPPLSSRTFPVSVSEVFQLPPIQTSRCRSKFPRA